MGSQYNPGTLNDIYMHRLHFKQQRCVVFSAHPKLIKMWNVRFVILISAFLKMHVVKNEGLKKKNDVLVPSKDLKKNIMALKKKKTKGKKLVLKKKKPKAVPVDTKKKKMKIVVKKKPPIKVAKKKPPIKVEKKKSPIKVVAKKKKFFRSARVAPE